MNQSSKLDEINKTEIRILYINNVENFKLAGIKEMLEKFHKGTVQTKRRRHGSS